MARLLTLGFENLGEMTLLDFSAITSDYYRIRRTTTARTGNSVLSFLGNAPYAMYALGAHPTELYGGFAFRYNASPAANSPILQLSNSSDGTLSQYMSINISNPSSTVYITRSGTTLATSAGNPTPANGVWAYCEFWAKPLNTNGRFVVKIDGATVIDFTGDTTNSQEYVAGCAFKSVMNSITADMQFDDIVLNDTSTSYNNTYPGIVRLLPIRASAAGGHADFDRAGVDFGSNFRQARDGRPESWLEGIADEYDLYDTDPVDLPVGATISNIVVQALAKANAGSAYIRPILNSNGSASEPSASTTLGTDWLLSQYAVPLDPQDSAAWTDADLATLEIGAKVKSS